MSKRRLVIKGSEWARGEAKLPRNPDGDGASNALLNGDGTRCCIGIDGKSRGIPDNILLHCPAPWRLSSQVAMGHIEIKDKELEKIVDQYISDWRATLEIGDEVLEREEHAVEINDALRMTDEERIKMLRPIFAEMDIILVWRPDL